VRERGVRACARVKADDAQGTEAVCTEAATPRRCGGQGDVLAGAMATMLAWALRHPRVRLPPDVPPLFVAAQNACMLVRAAGRRAYLRLGRAMLAGDVLQELPAALAHEEAMRRPSAM
jgi:ATP-dependent NAD(P)H-hydrate dehydratase